MTKAEKIAALDTAMTVRTRGAAKDGQLVPGGEEFTCFEDGAPETLVSLFLEHYEVRDLDHIIFSRACDIVAQVYEEDEEGTQPVEDAIYEKAPESASIWNDDRIGYVTVWNQDEIADLVREGETDICEAAATWYDRQVEQAAILISEWVAA